MDYTPKNKQTISDLTGHKSLFNNNMNLQEKSRNSTKKNYPSIKTMSNIQADGNKDKWAIVNLDETFK